MRLPERDPRHSLELQQRQTVEMSPRRKSIELFDRVDTYPKLDLRGRDFSYSQKEEFIQAIEDAITEEPGNTHVILFVGGPAQGKSTIASEASEYITRFSPAARAAKRKGRQIETYHLAWGDGFDKLPENIRVHTDYHTDPDTHARKQYEVDHAEKMLIEDLTTFFEWNKQTSIHNPKITRLIIGDIPLDSGIQLPDRTVGILRGYRLLKNLVHHKDDFQNAQYGSVFTAGVVASWDVREHAMENRRIAQHVSRTNLEDVEHQLKERGMVFADADLGVDRIFKGVKIAALKETAPPDEIERIVIGDNSDVIFALSRRQLRIPGDYGTERIRPVLDPEIFHSTGLLSLDQIREDHEGRARAIGEVVLPYIFDSLSLPHDKTTILYNGEILPRVTLHPQHLHRRISGADTNYK